MALIASIYATCKNQNGERTMWDYAMMVISSLLFIMLFVGIGLLAAGLNASEHSEAVKESMYNEINGTEYTYEEARILQRGTLRSFSEGAKQQAVAAQQSVLAHFAAIKTSGIALTAISVVGSFISLLTAGHYYGKHGVKSNCLEMGFAVVGERKAFMRKKAGSDKFEEVDIGDNKWQNALTALIFGGVLLVLVYMLAAQDFRVGILVTFFGLAGASAGLEYLQYRRIKRAIAKFDETVPETIADVKPGSGAAPEAIANEKQQVPVTIPLRAPEGGDADGEPAKGKEGAGVPPEKPSTVRRRLLTPPFEKMVAEIAAQINHDN